jgi:uncharacterized phiE125 gp8 family phage protein
MIRDKDGQVVTANLINRSTGLSVDSGTVTVWVLGNGGGKAPGLGSIENEGTGTWSYFPTRAETDFAAVTYSFRHVDAVPVDVQFNPKSQTSAAAGSAIISAIGGSGIDRYRYALRKIEAATEEAVSLRQAQLNCSVDGDEHDEMLVDLIQQAREYIEEHTDVSLLTTRWAMTFDAFPRKARWLYLPRWPAQSIAEVRYVAPDGSEQTIDSDDLVLRIDELGRGRLALKGWARWPSTMSTPDAVTIEFDAGWDSAPKVPPTWIRAMLMLITWWFEQREAAVIGTIVAKAPAAVDELIQSAATIDDFEDFDLCE